MSIDTLVTTRSTRRTCRVVSRHDVTSKVEFGVYAVSTHRTLSDLRRVTSRNSVKVCRQLCEYRLRRLTHKKEPNSERSSVRRHFTGLLVFSGDFIIF